jgi:hypothetical protein
MSDGPAFGRRVMRSPARAGSTGDSDSVGRPGGRLVVGYGAPSRRGLGERPHMLEPPLGGGAGERCKRALGP